MGKCLVTKLNGTISNDSILRIGEFVVDFNDKTTIKFNEVHDGIVQNGYFTNDAGENLGTTKTNSESFTCSKGSKLILTDKYGIINIECKNDAKCTINTEYLKFKKSNGGLYSCKGVLVGNTSDLKDKEYNTLQITGSKLSGKFTDISISDSIQYMEIGYTDIELNLSDLAPYKNLTAAFTLPNNTNGDLSVFDSNFSKLNVIYFGNNLGTVYGDMSKLSPSIVEVSCNHKSNSFTWKGTRPSSATICVFDAYANFGDDLDAMLINQANCQKGNTLVPFILTGNRTDASDAAVATLQSKGYTIWINDAQP